MFKHDFLSHILKVVGRKGIREEQRAPSVGEWIERKEESDEKDINHTYTKFGFNIQESGKMDNWVWYDPLCRRAIKYEDEALHDMMPLCTIED